MAEKYAFGFGMLHAGIEYTLNEIARHRIDDADDRARHAAYLRDLLRRADAVIEGHPQCSICRDFHSNDDRHPCE